MTETVFKCKASEVMDTYTARRVLAEKRFKKSCEQYRLALGNVERLYGIQFFDGGFAVTGWIPADLSLPLPVGWRRDGSSTRVVPAKRTAEGKVLAREINSLALEGNKYPGVPSFLSTGSVNGQGFHVFPRTEQIDGNYWLTLSKTPCDRDLAKIDSALWEPAKLSEYYAAKEAAGEG